MLLSYEAMSKRPPKKIAKKATVSMIGKGVKVVWADAEAKEEWATMAEIKTWTAGGNLPGPTYGILLSIQDDFIVVCSTYMSDDHICHTWKIPTAWIVGVSVIDEDPTVL